MSTTTKKVFKTANDTILIVSAKISHTNHSYVSVTADEISPILRSEAIEQVREGLEDGELWRMAVEAKSTTLGLDEWVDYVISEDGELSGFDNSLYTNEITVDGEDYIFASQSCGCLHDQIKKATDKYNRLIELHLSSNKKDLKEAEKILLSIAKTEDRDIDFWVEKYTREILGIDA